MSALHDNLRLRLELYADGELNADERRQVEDILAENPAARSYLRTLEELNVAVSMPVELCTEGIDFDAIQDRVFASIGQGDAEDHAQYAQMMAWADGELHDPAEVQHVFDYLARSPEARAALDAQREFHQMLRAVAREAEADVDFRAIQERVLDTVAPLAPTPSVWERPRQPVESVPSTGFFQKLAGWLVDYRTPVAAFAGVAFAAALMLPFALRNGQAPPTTSVTNHYYLGAADIKSIENDEGHVSRIQSGSEDTIPVVWFEPKSNLPVILADPRTDEASPSNQGERRSPASIKKSDDDTNDDPLLEL